MDGEKYTEDENVLQKWSNLIHCRFECAENDQNKG
jgi:hypothetical protein